MPSTEQQNQAADCMPHARVTDQHKLLEPFVGTWRAEVKMWMGPGDPMVSTGTMVNTLDLGGLFLRHDYTGDPNDGPFPNFEGRGFWGYNTVDMCWEGFWIDNAVSFMMRDTGDVDAAGKVWTMSSTMTEPRSGKPMQKRSVITLHSNNKHSMEMFVKPDDAPGEFKCMEITYTRA